MAVCDKVMLSVCQGHSLFIFEALMCPVCPRYARVSVNSQAASVMFGFITGMIRSDKGLRLQY